MGFRAKTFLAMAATGLLPVLLLGWLSWTTTRERLLELAGRQQLERAQAVADSCAEAVENGVRALQLSAGYIPFDELDDRDAGAALAIPYRQVPELTALALLDERGLAVAPPVVGLDGAREPLGPEGLDDLARHIPLAEALRTSAAIGRLYRPAGARTARVAAAVRAPGSKGRVLAAELALSKVQGRLDELSEAGQAAALLDAAGVPVATGSGAAQAVARAAPSAGFAMIEAGGEEWLAARAAVPGLGWSAVAATRASEALAAAREVRAHTAAWAGLALLLAAGFGWLLALALSRPVRALSAAAEAVGAGRYQRREGIEGPDELGRLGRAFNQMTEEVGRRDAEIRAFNAELQQRVDARTSELKAAQDQILRARRLAAMASLGAGAAHELNNPLTSLIGSITLAQRAPAAGGPHLEKALEEARRMARIVGELRQAAALDHDQAGIRFRLEEPVRKAVQAFAPRFEEAGVEVMLDLDPAAADLQGTPSEIQKLVERLLENALDAMPSGGRLAVTVAPVERDAVKLVVSDSGRGIAPELRERVFDPFFSTKERPSQLGLGLSICHAIAQAHHARIVVASEPGAGATFTVLFPAAAAAAHLY